MIRKIIGASIALLVGGTLATLGAQSAIPVPGLAAPANYGLNFADVAVVQGDWDGDSDIDLAVTGGGVGVGTGLQASPNLAILYNNGLGVFSAASVVSAQGGDKISSADMNGDGAPDLVVGDFYGSLNAGVSRILVFLNSGTGIFPPAPSATVNVTSSSFMRGLCTADLNGDGLPDVAAVEQGTDRVYVFLNGFSTGGIAGMFPSASAINFPAVSVPGSPVTNTNPSAVIATDVDLDGRLDLAYSLQNISTPPTISYVLNATTPGSMTPSFGGPVNVGLSSLVPIGLTSADYDADGRIDFACVSAPPGPNDFVDVYLQNSAGSFARVTYGNGVNHTDIASCDADADGDDDIIVTQATAGAPVGSFLINDGIGGFCTTPACPVSTSGAVLGVTSFSAPSPGASFGFARAIACDDFDGDGIVDFAVLIQGIAGNFVQYFKNLGLPIVLYPGSGEDFRLGTKVNTPGSPVVPPQFGANSQVEFAAPGQVVFLAMDTPSSTFAYAPLILAAQIFATNSTPVGQTPILWVNSNGAVILVNGGVPGPLGFQDLLMPGPIGYSAAIAIPFGLSGLGLSIMLQGVVLSPNAANGFYATSHGRQLIL